MNDVEEFEMKNIVCNLIYKSTKLYMPCGQSPPYFTIITHRYSIMIYFLFIYLLHETNCHTKPKIVASLDRLC